MWAFKIFLWLFIKIQNKIKKWFIWEIDKLLLIWERDRHWFVFPLIYVFIGWLFYMSWLGIEPATLAYWDNALTNWAVNQGLK